MRTLLLASITLAASFATPPEHVTRVFELQHADPGRVEKLIKTYPNCGLASDYSLRRLVVCASKENMTAIEEAVAQMDRAAHGVNLELTIYFITASNGPAKTNAQPLPPGLEPVTKQLASVLAFKHFHLVEILIARTREGQSLNVSSASGDNPPTTYNFHIDSSRVSSGDKGRMIRLDNLQVMIARPYTSGVTDGKPNLQYTRGGIDRTDVEGREGQSLVVGKTSISNNEATIIVLVPKITD